MEEWGGAVVGAGKDEDEERVKQQKVREAFLPHLRAVLAAAAAAEAAEAGGGGGKKRNRGESAMGVDAGCSASRRCVGVYDNDGDTYMTGKAPSHLLPP